MASVTMTEMTSAPPMETVHMKLQTKSSLNMAPRPPAGPKPKGQLRIDPLRALEPARKKLSTLEAQRIMAVLVDSIRKTELVTALPFILANLDRFKVALGAELAQMLERHNIIISSFEEIKGQAGKLLEKEKNKRQQDDAIAEEENFEQGRPASSSSVGSQAENALRNLQLVARQMQESCKNILRAFTASPATLTTVLKDFNDRSENSAFMITEMNELKDIVMCMLLTTPVEELERNQYLKQVSQRERNNASIIGKLETELKAACDDKESEIKKKKVPTATLR